ncbi:restriction endonuclease [Halalkalibacter krulwichiae]|uniref:Restriction endonuclease n=1 Tax=Halalkalibacter krulwichiae TaxID=199441 RepID=A0A1X9MHX4_9BACI|nr:restriction endonuclease [Halalkalibacter krulwichiae]ARK31813.1 Restriction endonuclease [Halalkalibacter krulwichiae]
MSKSSSKHTNKFVPISFFLTTYIMVQLYNYDFTLFGLSLAALLTFIGIWYLFKEYKIFSPHRSATFMNIDEISDQEFQQLLVPIFQNQGYSVNKMKETYKSKADLILRRKGEKAIVFLKRQANNVGSTVIKDAISCKPTYQASKVIVVSNRQFTKSAKLEARANKVILIDRDSLDALLDAYLQHKRSHRFIQRVRTLFFREDIKSDS